MYTVFRIQCVDGNLNKIEQLIGRGYFTRLDEENPDTHFLIKIKDGKACHCRRVPTLIQLYDTIDDLEQYLLECMLEG